MTEEGWNHAYATTRAPGCFPAEGWRASIVQDERSNFRARCNCGWVDPWGYIDRSKARNRARQHRDLHNEGLVGPGDAWPSLQSTSWPGVDND